MKVYNAQSRTKEEFIPLEEKKVKMYACGITVYDECHIGHARQAITFDVISQYFRYKGYDVTYVRNYTDVDDKIIARANSLGMNALVYSKQKIDEAEEDLQRLKVKDADIKPKASEYIEKIVLFIDALIKKGHAYPTAKGDVYFDVASFETYGKLSNRNTDELLNGVRKDVEDDKNSPIDFALWKSAKEGEIYWESPWGNGRPGWHIECSAMVIDTLGDSIDIHGGGKDLIFPHHENEIAQSEAYTGKPFAKYWIHNGLITINGQKMSKSLGNSLTIKQALDKYDNEVIRYAMMEKHYATAIDLNDLVFSIAERHLYYFYNTIVKMDAFITETENISSGKVIDVSMVDKICKDFENAMDDDFNTAEALSYLFANFKYMNTLLVNKKAAREDVAASLKKIKEESVKTYALLGLLQEEPEAFVKKLKGKYMASIAIKPEEILVKIDERNSAKAAKNYALADEIRNSLLEQGIILNDSKDGTTWDIKELYMLN